MLICVSTLVGGMVRSGSSLTYKECETPALLAGSASAGRGATLLSSASHPSRVIFATMRKPLAPSGSMIATSPSARYGGRRRPRGTDCRGSTIARLVPPPTGVDSSLRKLGVAIGRRRRRGPAAHGRATASRGRRSARPVSRVRQYGLARTSPTGIPSARMAAPIARASARPSSVRLRCFAQSS